MGNGHIQEWAGQDSGAETGSDYKELKPLLKDITTRSQLIKLVRKMQPGP